MVANGKTEEWRTAAHEVIKKLAQENSIIVSDMVVATLEADGLGLDNYSTLGGVFTRAAKEGIISKTDQQQQSTRAKSNSAKTVWVSLIYQKEEIGPQARLMNQMLIAALDFNAETVRYASFVYRSGGLDEKNHQKAVADFRRIQSAYSKRVDLILKEYATVGGITDEV